MITKQIKLVSVNGVDEKTKNMIKDIYATAINTNQVMLDNIPSYKFRQGDILYFTDLRKIHPTIESLEVECMDEWKN